MIFKLCQSGLEKGNAGLDSNLLRITGWATEEETEGRGEVGAQEKDKLEREST